MFPLPLPRLGLALGCILGLMAPLAPATAQTPRAPFEDTLAQRLQACTVCHGAQGRAAPDGYYPRIAGKPAAYLYNQLLNFQEGRRHYRPMVQMVDPLTPAYLWEIAQYFARLDLPYPPPAAVQASSEQLARGRVLAQQGDSSLNLPACASCHGAQLTGTLPQVPGLLGLPRDYLNGQMGAWRTGQRQAHGPDCMAQITHRLDQDDVSAVSAWLASQPVPAGAKPAPVPREPLPLTCGNATPPEARP